jgi:hypothetical protein
MMGIASLNPSYKFEMVLTVGWVEAFFADTHRTLAFTIRIRVVASFIVRIEEANTKYQD